MHSHPPDAKRETKTTPPPRAAIYQYLSKSFTEEKEFVQHSFSSLGRANEFLRWLIEQSIPPMISAIKIKEIEQKAGERKEKEYIVRLSPEQHKQLLLPSAETVSTIPLTPLQIETETGKLINAFESNQIGTIDKIMREMSAENQEALFRQFYSRGGVPLLPYLIVKFEGKKDTAFFIFISHCCSAAIVQSLYSLISSSLIKNLTALHLATKYLKSESFQDLMNKISTEYIDQLLCIQTLGSSQTLPPSQTPLAIAALRGRTDIFCALINKASPTALNKTLLLRYIIPDKWSIFHAIAYHQLGTPFITLINKADSQVISSLLPLQDSHGDTGLHYAIRYQPSDAVSLLIERSTPEALSQTCSLSNHYGHSILDYILSYHPPQVVAALLNKIDDDALRFMLRWDKGAFPQLLAMFVNYLGHEPSWQTDSLMGRLLFRVPSLANALCKFWLAGKELPVEVIKRALPYVEFKPPAPPEFKQIYDIWKQELEQKEKKEAKQDLIVITLRSGKTISITPVRGVGALSHVAREIWKAGLASVADYRLIQQCFPKTVLSQATYELYRSGLLFSGCCIEMPEFERIDPKLDQVIQEGDALIKAVRESRSEEFLKQISNYNYRPADLRIEVDKTKITHKVVHLQNKTVAYEYHNPAEKKASIKKAVRKHTKKMPATAFSKQCTTSVFGEHDINQPVVCFMFNRKQTIIKMMASQDIGTHARDWAGSEEDVEKYYERHKGIFFTDYDAFCKWVNENPTRLNELLVKVSRESLLAITIVTDTKEARALAISYQISIKARCRGIDLPIFFYDRALREMRPYSRQEQHDDRMAVVSCLPFYNATREKHDALMCRRAIDQYFYKDMKVEGQYCFSSLDNAKAFLDWIKVQPIFSEPKNWMIETRERKQDGPEKVTEYTVQLSKEQRKELLSLYFTKSAELHSRSRTIKYLRERLYYLINNNSIGELDNLMQGILESDLIAILLTDFHGHLLNQTACYGREPIFIVFLSHCSDSVLSQTCLLTYKFGWTILHTVAQHLPGEGFCRLINRMDPALIDKALLMPVTDDNYKGSTALHFAIIYQPGHAVSALINKASAAAINQACLAFDNHKKSVFDYTFSCQPPEIVVQLLNKIDDQSLAFLFKSPDMAAQVISLIKNHLSKEPGWPTQPLVTRLLKHLSAMQIAECYCQLWLLGQNFPQEMKPDFEGLIREKPEHAAELKEIQNALTQEHKDEILSLPKDEKDFPAFAKTIWQKGISSLSELHTLRKRFPDTIISTVVDELYQAGLLFTGCSVPYNPPAFLPKISMQLKIEPLFPVVDQSANKLRAAHDKAIEIARYVSILRDDYKIDSSSAEKKTWMMYFQEIIPSYSPEIIYSAAVKMANLLEGQSQGFSEKELLALRLGKLGETISELERKGLLPEEFIKQEERAAIERRGLSGRR